LILNTNKIVRQQKHSCIEGDEIAFVRRKRVSNITCRSDFINGC